MTDRAATAAATTATTTVDATATQVRAMEDRLRSMHVTLLFIAVVLCVMFGLNLVLLTAD